MTQLIPTPEDYYEALTSSEEVGGEAPVQKEFEVPGCSINTFAKMLRKFEEPTRGVHEAWCMKFPAKARRLNDLYTRIWGSDDPDESIEQSSVFSGVTAEFLAVECEAVRRAVGVSALDRRFALEQLATLAEIRKDWARAHQLIAEMLDLQAELGDPIYLGRALVRKAYVVYKHARASGIMAKMDEAETDLRKAELVWLKLRGQEWRKYHPDVKAYIKYGEISALILARRGKFPEAISAIQNASELRHMFSGDAGKASGAYREGVIYSQAAGPKNENATHARNAFKSCIELREKLHLWGDAGIAAWRCAQFERTEVEAGRTSSARWLSTLKKAFKCFEAADDPIRSLDVSLAMIEHSDPDFWDAGCAAMLRAVPRAFDAGFRRGRWQEFRQCWDRPGWAKWSNQHKAGRALLHHLLRRFAPATERREAKNVSEERRVDIRKTFAWLEEHKAASSS
jgi:hypothetical protein